MFVPTGMGRPWVLALPAGFEDADRAWLLPDGQRAVFIGTVQGSPQWYLVDRRGGAPQAPRGGSAGGRGSRGRGAAGGGPGDAAGGGGGGHTSQCEVCGKTCANARGLLRHKKVHSEGGAAPVQASVAGSASSSSSSIPAV